MKAMAAEKKSLLKKEQMSKGVIYKALSGFYYVASDGKDITCRARGKFRKDNNAPLVGDLVEISLNSETEGNIEKILPRKNSFIRPQVANVDQLIIIASAAIPITDPFLIDRIATISVFNSCEPIVCINKKDIDPAEELYTIYKNSGFKTVLTSAETGEGIEELRQCLKGKISVFTGNSGVGKSSILNRLSPKFNIKTAEVSQKLGRGKHTTRHIELYELEDDTFVADTPGFSSFDMDILNETNASEIQNAYREFEPYIGKCKFLDCVHLKEKGCAVVEAVKNGHISKTRHENYMRLYEMAKSVKEWEIKK